MGSYSASAQHLVDEMRSAALAEPARGLAFQGAPGANSDLAAREYDSNSLPLPCYAFQDAIDAVRDGRVDRAIIPIENSLHGRVADIHFLLPESGLSIVGEHFLPIRYGLMSRDLGPVTRAMSHEQALGRAGCSSMASTAATASRASGLKTTTNPSATSSSTPTTTCGGT